MWIVVTCLSFFSAYILLDLGTTLSMFTPLLANKFDLLPDILHEAFLVSTHIGDSVKAEGICIEVDGIVSSLFVVKLGVIKFNS